MGEIRIAEFEEFKGDSSVVAVEQALKFMKRQRKNPFLAVIWYGSPQDQIQAFRAFQISEALQEQQGYPALTPEIKAKIFGLNALKPYNIERTAIKKKIRHDAVEVARLAYQPMADPHFQTLGPKTRRDFLNLMRWTGGNAA